MPEAEQMALLYHAFYDNSAAALRRVPKVCITAVTSRSQVVQIDAATAPPLMIMQIAKSTSKQSRLTYSHTDVMPMPMDRETVTSGSLTVLTITQQRTWSFLADEACEMSLESQVCKPTDSVRVGRPGKGCIYSGPRGQQSKKR